MTTQNIPYGRHLIDEKDIAAVTEALRSEWLTCGPRVYDFEQAVAAYCGTQTAVAVCNGTAALHCAVAAFDVGPGDEVIVPPLTFCATANAVVYQGATPVFADISPETLLLDPRAVEACITNRTKGIIAVDYTGHPCDYSALRSIASRNKIFLVADACHSLGGSWQGCPVGTLADITCLSFHPVKHITTGEGGMALTDDPTLARRMSLMRNHGIDKDVAQRAALDTWQYDMVDLGHNYRITDIQCALGLEQLKKLPAWLQQRTRMAELYTKALADIPGITPLQQLPEATHAWHLYVVRVDTQKTPGRDAVIHRLRKKRILANVHYIPVYKHSFYRRLLQNTPPLCPVSDAAFEEILSLPLHAGMCEADVKHVVATLRHCLQEK